MSLPGGRRESKKLGTPAKSAGSKELPGPEARSSAEETATGMAQTRMRVA